MESFILYLIQSSCSVLFCWKATQKHGFPPPFYTVGMLFLGIFLILLFPPHTAFGVYTKTFYFGLLWPHDFHHHHHQSLLRTQVHTYTWLSSLTPLDHSDSRWQTWDWSGQERTSTGELFRRCMYDFKPLNRGPTWRPSQRKITVTFSLSMFMDIKPQSFIRTHTFLWTVLEEKRYHLVIKAILILYLHTYHPSFPSFTH